MRLSVAALLVLSITLTYGNTVPDLHAQYPHRTVNPALLEGIWEASWIEHPMASPHAYGVYHFRKTFALSDLPGSFVVHVSADNRYRLFVNGTPVATGPARGDLMRWRYESINLAPFLRQGDNVVAAVVWNHAEHRPEAQFSYRTAFLLQGDTDQEAILNTNDTWKVTQNLAYQPYPVDRAWLDYKYIVVGPGDKVEGVTYPWGWEVTGYDDEAWEKAKIFRGATQHWGPKTGVFTGWKLAPRMIPMMEETREAIPRIARTKGIAANDGFLKGSGALVIPARSRVTILLDQTHLTTAYPELVVSGGAGSQVTQTYAEALFDDKGQKGNRDELEGKEIRGNQDVFLPDGGPRRLFRPLWWRTYRYLQLDIETGAEALSLEEMYGMFTAYPFKEEARFASSDTVLSSIWEVGWRTARLCAGETYFDCPYYEQLQYVGDTRVQTLISLYVSGDDRLMRKAIQLFDDSRISNGLTQSRYPSFSTQFIGPYSLLWIAMVYDYWRYRDDPAFVESFLRGIRGVSDWYEQKIDASGMVGKTPWWNYVDWSFPRGVPPGGDEGHSSIISLTYAYVLNYAAELAEAYDRPDEAAHYRALAGRLKQATLALCWDEERGLVADTPEKTSFSQHANVMAVLVDLLPEDEQQSFMNKVYDDPLLTQTSYYFRFYLDRAMRKVGLAERYIESLKPWREMLDLGLTTFAERPEPTRSDAHAWSASPNYFLLATVCGIESDAPGFKQVRIAPALGGLEWVEGEMPHPMGTLRVMLKKKPDGGLTGEVTLPEGLTGMFIWKGTELPLTSGTQSLNF